MRKTTMPRRFLAFSRSVVFVVMLLLVLHVPVHGSAVSAPPSAMMKKDPNIVMSMVNYVKDSAVRTLTGVVLLKKNHSQCNEIRGKLKLFRQQLQQEWENQGTLKDETPKEIQRRLQERMGGISYEEFCFLKRGKDDRGKLFNLVFLVWGAPRFLPYALMFNPTMLPSTFQPPELAGSHPLENPCGWPHAMIASFLQLQATAAAEPATGIMSTILGKKKEKIAQHEQLQTIVQETQAALQHNTPILELLEKLPSSSSSRRTQRLAHFPPVLTRAAARIVAGQGGAPGIISLVSPTFLARSSLVTHLEQLASADNFLRQTGTFPQQRKVLEAACRDRLLPIQNVQTKTPLPMTVLQDQLQEWLNVTQHHSTTVGRFVVLMHNGCTTLRQQEPGLVSHLYQQPMPSIAEQPAETTLQEAPQKQGRRRRNKK